MTEQEKAAINVLDQACTEFRGTRKDHAILADALRIIRTGLETKTQPKRKRKVKVPKRTWD